MGRVQLKFVNNCEEIQTGDVLRTEVGEVEGTYIRWA